MIDEISTISFLPLFNSELEETQGYMKHLDTERSELSQQLKNQEQHLQVCPPVKLFARLKEKVLCAR